MPVQYINSKTSVFSGTYTHPNSTTETDVLEILGTNGQVKDAYIILDTSTLTINNVRVRTYLKVDGTTYDLYSTIVLSASDNFAEAIETLTDFDMKVTMQSNIAEGATRAIPYRYYIRRQT